jgi:hypothetical protein
MDHRSRALDGDGRPHPREIVEEPRRLDRCGLAVKAGMRGQKSSGFARTGAG